VLPPDARLTPQRCAVLDEIGSAHGTFTATELLERARLRHPRLGLATVYRTLELLRAAGDVRRVAGTTATYMRCAPGHHHHLVCVACGTVEETDLCAAPADAELERRHGFRAQAHEVEIYGTCARCA
jgi:Fur family ferric uptake transcriptional regulator